MATKYTYTQVPEDAFEKLAINAGILVDDFDPDTRKLGNQIGASTGGITIICTPSFVDMGDDVDNCPKNTMELKNIESYACKVSGTMVTIDVSSLTMFVGAADTSGKKIAPRMRLTTTDFKTLWYICDYGEGGFIAVKLLNALSTAGVSIKSTDKNKAQFAFEFTGHSSMADQDTVPMEFYIDGTEAAS
jgi:hypothetical protein